MTRIRWSAVAVLTMAVAVPAIAQMPHGRGGRGFGGGMGPGPGGPAGPPPGPGAPVLRQLDLTETQREQIREITAEARDERKPAPRIALQQQLHAAVFADTPDLQKIEELKAALAALDAAELSMRIDVELRIAQVLTPEQRARAREALARGPARPHAF